MSYYAVLDNQEQTGGDVASAGGWHDFTRWIERLEGLLEGLDELRHLVAYGWSDDLPSVTEQLKQAMESGEPRKEERDTAKALLAILFEPKDAEVLVITDGVLEA